MRPGFDNRLRPDPFGDEVSARVFAVVPDYESGPVSKQVVRVVLSYIDYVNRTVWRRGYG